MNVRTFRLEEVHARLVPKSTLLKALNYLDKTNMQTPFLLIDRERVKESLSLIGRGIRNSRVYYALKANPDLEVADFVRRLGWGFEVASEGELRMLHSIGVSADRMISSNPIKPLKFLELAHELGLNYFSYDSSEEVDKIGELAPGSNVYVRLSVPNEGSEWPLSKKFGVEIDDAANLLVYAKEKALNPVGITFHVGSQCTNLYNWNIAIDKAKILWDIAEGRGIRLRLLNIGGGYPVSYTRSVIQIATIEENIETSIRERFPLDTEIHIEPGRAVVGDAGIMVTSVIGKARRSHEDWLYIDVGVFNGLMESLGGIRYTYLVESNAETSRQWTVAGPSCDSFDVIDKNVSLWEPDVGNLLLILSGGAYTVSYASEFNGFSIPKSILI